ncbi:MAG TPA: hypothetical protein VG165_11950 [Solirubrobacteraceae bacterium]|nr:hypothetical protein [Solirubrobacteraceae bacterium]
MGVLAAGGLALAGTLGIAGGASAEINASQPAGPSAVEITPAGILWTANGMDLAGPDGLPAQVFPVPGGVIDAADLAVGPRVGRGGCRDWVADPTGATSETGVAVAVAADQLIVAGSPACRRTPPTTPRPLFARRLSPGGGWRVLRWLPSATQPVLSARGDWLAVGIPRADGTMLAEVIDARTGRVRNALDMPGAYLAVAESGALVAAVGYVTTNGADEAIDQTYRMLYVPAGARTAEALLASDTVYGVPSVSDGRVAYELVNPDTTSTLAVTNLRTHRTRLVAGFRPGERELFALDLRGDELAWVQGDDQPPPTTPPPGPCTLTPYIPPPARTLHTADLSRPAGLVPAPPAPIGPAPEGPPALACNQQ